MSAVSQSLSASENGRLEEIVGSLRALVSEVTGIASETIDINANFLEVGIDSLTLIQASLALERKFGVKLSVIQILEKFPTITAIAVHLDRELPPDTGFELPSQDLSTKETSVLDVQSAPLSQLPVNHPEEVAPTPTSTPFTEPAVNGNGLEWIIAEQLKIMAQQLEILRGDSVNEPAPSAPQFVLPARVLHDAHAEQTQSEPIQIEEVKEETPREKTQVAATAVAPSSAAQISAIKSTPYVPYQPIEPGSTDGLTPRQQRHLDQLIADYNKRTRESKRMTQVNRRFLADSRSTVGFRLLWKDLIYPIIGQRSLGSSLWDVDGNEYIDIAMGFGVHLFGHSPPFVVEALKEQMKAGMQLGPQSLLAGKVAELICQMTGSERVNFCNSGTEAIIGATRLARTITRRDKIAIFAGAYHGWSDGTMARQLKHRDKTETVPVAPGITRHAVADVLVLDWDDPQSLAILKAHHKELAAVLVEPVQSRRPDIQPKALLQELRDLTARTKTVLIFDEIVTGFRIDNGGAQAYFDVQADLVTYGKVLGGGLPIGVIAGKAAYMDAFDGGWWNYDDNSYPKTEKTIFAGSFFKNPLTMAASLAVLEHLKDQPELLPQLNQRTSRFAESLNAYFEQTELPIRTINFGSLFRFVNSPSVKWMDLFFYHLLNNGIYTWEGRNCFLSTAHTDEDLDRILRAVASSVKQMQNGGFFPDPAPTATSSAEQATPEHDGAQPAIHDPSQPAKEPATQAASPPVPRDDRPYSIPLLKAQQQLWIASQVSTEASVAYNESISLRMRGPLDLPALRRALQHLVDRHESLRITFSPDGDYQWVAPALKLEVPLQDLSHLKRGQREEELTQSLQVETRQPFDLVHGPLIRACVVKLEADSHLLVLTYHHLIVDGRSTSVLLNDLRELYVAECRGLPSSLPPAQPFSAFVERQMELQQRPAMASDESYWLEQFADHVPVLQLPTDRPRPPVQTYSGAQQRMAIDTALYGDLKKLSAEQGSTILMVLFAVCGIFLHRWSGQEDLVIGTAAAGQVPSGFKDAVGYCLNMLPLRCKSTGDPTFREYLAAVRRMLMRGFEHQNYTFGELIRRLDLPFDASRSPLFSVIFVFDRSGAEMRFHDLDVSIYENPRRLAQFELEMNFVETNGALVFEWTYNTDLFDAETIQRMMRCCRNLLQSVVINPEQKLWDLPLLTADDQRQILHDWNATSAPLSDKCLHELVKEQVARTPQQVAVVFEDEELSYDELNRRANQLAHHLQDLGVGPEVPVGILVDRSLEMLVGMLGILKAGGAYLPLDPGYPQERLAFMMEDAGVAVLLTLERFVDALPQTQTPARVVRLDADWDTIAGESEENPDRIISGDNLAYIIYTSGSTGKPKGVMITHGAIVNRLLWMQTSYALTSDDRVLQKTVISFDVSVWELFWPLLVGARLVLARPGGHQDSGYLCELIKAAGVTTLHFVPSMLAVFVEEERVRQCESLRLVISSGEALSEELSERFYERLGAQVKLHNLYGPTEAAIDVSAWECERSSRRGCVPIGRPIANLTLYILDERLRAVPVGVAGELYIGGVGLGRGYWGRPELTAERFIPHPYSVAAGERLYRTGDVARYAADGAIEYLGRVDHQVKVRGFRIELGEIEALLTRHRGVLTAVVVAREDSHGEKRLVAYVVPEQGNVSTVSVQEVNEYLRDKLPEYMVPSAIVMLAKLPLTANGKVDRRALPEALPSGMGDNELAAARTPLEEILVSIWKDVLRVERVGVHDNFFKLGGHSLLATRLISRLRHQLSVEVSLHTLFEAPTISGFAARVEQLLGIKGKGSLPELVVGARPERLPLSYAQERLWFIDQLQPKSAAYNLPLAVRLRGALNLEALRRSLQRVIERHELLRTSFVMEDEEPSQVIAPTLELELPVIDLSELEVGEREQQVVQLLAAEASTGFDLSAAPLLRAKLLKLGAEEHIASLTMHHIISDGWSLGVLTRELAAFYNAEVEQPSGSELHGALPPLPLQYADYALLQREWLSGGALETQLNYWRDQLAGAPVLELPSDRPRPVMPSMRGAQEVFQVSAELTAQLRALALREGATLFMVLLAVFEVLLARYSGQRDLVVGTPIANRNWYETEELIGFFVNMLALRVKLRGQESFRGLVREVREVTLAAYAHQDVPFEKLVEELQPERDTSRQPIFQVIFALQNAPQEALQLKGLAVSGAGGGGTVSKYDLGLVVEESGGGLVCVIEYCTELFEAETIRRMSGHWRRLCEEVVRDSEQSIWEMKMLGAKERKQLVTEWNETWSEYPRELSIAELFEQQAALRPDAIAVVYEGEQLTYRELNERANQVANYLQKKGVLPETLVGVSLERSLEMVTALVGIVKAGGAYLPLDPEYPRQRLELMLQEAGATIVLTQGEIATVADESRDNPGVRTSLENLAYVSYTSGSTGRPKGVAVPQRGVLRLVLNTNYIRLDENDVVLQMAPLAFDASTFEVWGALLNGGRLVVMRAGGVTPAEIAEVLKREQVTTLWLTAGLFHLMVNEQSDALATVTKLLAGGDVLQRSAVTQVMAMGSGVLINGYGPTENTTFSCCHVMERGVGAEITGETVPIGRAVANTQVYVVDDAMKVVPVGVSGELLLGGEGLARGYLQQPEMTAASFIPDSFSSETGTRLYRTGDVVRYRSNGELEFIGRRDEQVKVRGFRIELGEVELVLASHPAVKQCSVVARGGDDDGKRLIGYVVWREGESVSVSKLREYLSERLPEYMIPGQVVELEELPLNANGKVDRRALPLPEEVGVQGTEYEAPRTPVQEILAGIWADVLGFERVGIHDNFFELGGHSLLALKIISRVQEAFKLKLQLRMLFERPTIAGLAETITPLQSDGKEVEGEGSRSAPPDKEEELLTRIDQLSDQEVNTLLQDLLTEEQATQ